MNNDPEYRKSFEEARGGLRATGGRIGPASLSRHVAPVGQIGGGEGDHGHRVQRPAPHVPAEMPEPVRCSGMASTVSSRLRRSCDHADRNAWPARPLRKRLQRQRQSRWIRNLLLNWNRLQRKSMRNGRSSYLPWCRPEAAAPDLRGTLGVESGAAQIG